MSKRSDIEMFIKMYIPKGWVGPIREFDFCPMISEEEAEMIVNGKLPESLNKKWYVAQAIQAYWKKNP